jgi:ATP-dependent Clp protease adapter protein ClpS
MSPGCKIWVVFWALVVGVLSFEVYEVSSFTLLLYRSSIQPHKAFHRPSSSYWLASTVIERPQEKDRVVEILDDKTVEKENKYGGEGWEIRLWNDPFNKREFVARCLSTICGKSDTESYQIMMQAHNNGYVFTRILGKLNVGSFDRRILFRGLTLEIVFVYMLYRMGVIGRYNLEIAERYHKGLKENGLTVDMVQVDDE